MYRSFVSGIAALVMVAAVGAGAQEGGGKPELTTVN